jgi:hypothetical protein
MHLINDAITPRGLSVMELEFCVPQDNEPDAQARFSEWKLHTGMRRHYMRQPLQQLLASVDSANTT